MDHRAIQISHRSNTTAGHEPSCAAVRAIRAHDTRIPSPGAGRCPRRYHAVHPEHAGVLRGRTSTGGNRRQKSFRLSGRPGAQWTEDGHDHPSGGHGLP